MAGDWIPLMVDTPDKPELVTLASRLCHADKRDARAQVLGHAITLWSYASKHTTDGHLSLTLADLPAVLGGTPEIWGGFVEVGWLQVTGNGLYLPNAEWLTKAGKAREQDRKRKARQRERKVEMSRTCHAEVRGTSVTREEKRREEKIKDTPLTPRGGIGDVPAAFQSTEARAAIDRWIAYRSESRLRPWKPSTWRAQWSELTPERFIAAVNHSIANGYQGLYEPKENTNGNRPSRKVLAGPGQVHEADRVGGYGEL